MTQFTVLTSETKTIVVNFFNAQMKKNIYCEPNKQLMVSLYSLMPEANSKVIGKLKQYIISLSDYFQESEINLLKSEYSAVVKFCYDSKHYAGVPRRGENLLVPQSLVDLCMRIAEPKSGSSVFVPYSGDGSFAYHVADCMVEGFEKDEVSWAFSQILLHSQRASANIRLGDSAIPEEGVYDYIFSFPPMMNGRDGRQIIDTVYNLITKHLADNGELYCILPMTFCSIGSGWFDVRKILWDYSGQYSALVVSLPTGILPYSTVGLCLLHIKKNNKDIVALMDATGEEFSAKHNVADYKEHILKVESIIETINNRDEKYVWVGTSSQLTGYVSLQPSRYLISQILPQPKSGEMSYKLSDVIQVVPLIRQDEETLQIIARRNRLVNSSVDDSSVDSEEREEIFAKYRKLERQSCPLIGMKELSTSYLNCDIKRDSLEPSRQGVPYSILTSDCLLVGFIGGKFKVGRLLGVSPDSPVALRNEVLPIQLSSDNITEDFLLRCIMSEQSERQARMLSTGTIISRLSRQDLLSIVICVPALKEQQDELCKEDTRASLTEADRKQDMSLEEFRKDMHMKKHAIGQTIFNINNWWNLLKLAREKGNGIVDDRTELGFNRKVKVADIYANLEIAMAKLSTQLSKFDTGYGLRKESIPLTMFIEHYISEHESPLFEFIYDSTTHHAERDMPEMYIDGDSMSVIPTGKYIHREGDPLEYAIFAPEALTIVFNNIISNACVHGFKNKTAERNLIRIEILSEGTDYVITISNNGEPLKELTSQEVLTYGLTTEHSKTTDVANNHFGIGGYEIKKLMTEFNGDVEVISTPNEDFAVTYRLVFHNTYTEKTL